MSDKLPLPNTLQEAVVFFSDPRRTFDYAVKLRWPDGKVTCPRCDGTEHSFISTRLHWFCKGCKKQFTVKVGTIFEDSPIGMDKWMVAVWMIVNCKNGISSYEIHRALGITQKSAWFMMHRIRLALQARSLVKLGRNGGPVEVDETFIGGKARNMSFERYSRTIKDRRLKGKIPVVGILERGGKVRAMVTAGPRKQELQAVVRENVALGSEVHTDALKSYEGLNIRGYGHKTIDHANAYVDGQIHTNGLENFWSLLKRGLKGTYISVEPFHLFRYLDEQVYRYNNRATKNNPVNDGDRFIKAMETVVGRRITYEELTGKGTDSIHHEEAGTW